MNNRLELHNILESIVGPNIYYQPPESVKLKYPCVIYKRTAIDLDHADDHNYTKKNRYTITIITKSPDFIFGETLLDSIPYCTFDRNYVVDNLQHDVYSVYY